MPDIMSKADYDLYRVSVAEFMQREGLANLSPIPNGEDSAEPYFSWRACECCGCNLGGDREDCHGYNPTTGEVQGPYSVCLDCVYYSEYRRLDDDTMMRVEGEGR